MNFLYPKSNLPAFCLLALTVFLVFGNALFNDFVYDDGYLIIENKFIKSFSHLKEILLSDVTVTSPLSQASGYYRPVSMIFLMIVYQWWGLNPFGWHLTSVLIHFLNTFLVYLLLARLSQNRSISFLASLIFAVHPIHVEAVAPAYNSMGLLASFFSLTSFLAFIKAKGVEMVSKPSDSLPFAQSPAGLVGMVSQEMRLSFLPSSLPSPQVCLRTRQGRENQKGYTFLSAGLLLLGLFAKEETIVLPVIFLLYDFYFISQFSWRNIFKKWKSYVLFFGMALFYLAMRLQVVEKDAALGLWDLNLAFNVTPATNLFWHLLTVIKIFYFYILVLILPFYLSAFHVITAVSSLADVVTVFSMVVIFELIVCALYLRQRAAVVSFLVLMFFVATLPVSNIVPIGGIFAERFMYLPSITYCFLLAFVGERLYRRFDRLTEKTRRNTVLLIGMAIVSVYALKSAERNYAWRNNLVLWRDTVAKSPGSAVARLNLADSYFSKKLYDEALGQYQAAMSLSHFKEFHVHNSIGKIYGLKQEYELALREFQKAIELNNRFVEGYYNLGITYFHKMDMHSASRYFAQARDLDPAYPWSYYGLGLVLEQKRQLSLAKEMFRKTLDLDPDHRLAQKALERLAP